MKVGSMLQFIIVFLPVLAVIAAVLRMAAELKTTGRSLGRLLNDYSWCIANSPAQVAFFMFSFASAIAAGIISGAFTHIATQWILTFDILFLISILLLITFHRLKLHSSASL
jgi:uncharacterized membrane protein YjjP (DUF1212 family)